jgi:hypothetical protein
MSNTPTEDISLIQATPAHCWMNSRAGTWELCRIIILATQAHLRISQNECINRFFLFIREMSNRFNDQGEQIAILV